MADDIVSLRQHISTLERENSALRRNLALHEDIGRALLQDIDLDVMTKAEIVDRICKRIVSSFSAHSEDGGGGKGLLKRKGTRATQKSSFSLKMCLTSIQAMEASLKKLMLDS